MTPILSRAQARAFDAFATHQAHVPSVLLMENAGRAAAEVVLRLAAEARCAPLRVVVVCGTGNNGGDGLVVARHLLARGITATVFLAGDPASIRGDARVNYEALLGVGAQVTPLPDGVGVPLPPELTANLDGTLVVDALFGTGLSRPLGANHAALIKALSSSGALRVALDLPSGLDADTGRTLGAVAFEAHHTVTFGHTKLGLETPNGRRLAGVVHVVDLGVPARLGPGSAPAASRVERADVAALFPPREVDVHKNGAGHVLVLGGSFGKVGAPLMVAHGALRAGAGLTTIATWSDAFATLQSRVLEEMTAAIDPKDLDGSLASAFKGKTTLVAGPGLGLDDDAKALIRAALSSWEGPAVYDADALTMFAGHPEEFRAAKQAPVLTPHAGEMGRLLGISSKDVEGDRFAAARTLAEKARAVVLLKGAATLVASPEGRVVVNSSGNAALATAGAGDTLGGILGAFLCALPPFEAAFAAAYVHGLAGDAFRADEGDRGLLASEIADRVPRVLAALTRSRRL